MTLFIIFSYFFFFFFFFSSRRRHTRFDCDWSSDVCSSDLKHRPPRAPGRPVSPAPRAAATPGSGRSRLPSGEDSQDRKSTRLNSSHSQISYAVFCLKKKKKKKINTSTNTKKEQIETKDTQI